LLRSLHKSGGSQLGYSKIARDANLSNATSALGYIELLRDLMCVAVLYFQLPLTNKRLIRKPAKFHFTNLLLAASSSPFNVRTAEALSLLPKEEYSKWLEWLVAQELWRRRVIANIESPEELAFYNDHGKKIDFLLDENSGLEVKSGQASPDEFNWIKQKYPSLNLSVICKNKLPEWIAKSLSIEEFLLTAY
jgi:predicted AAA+ superfamily ATPase